MAVQVEIEVFAGDFLVGAIRMNCLDGGIAGPGIRPERSGYRKKFHQIQCKPATILDFCGVSDRKWTKQGKVAEWSNAPDSKSGIRL